MMPRDDALNNASDDVSNDLLDDVLDGVCGESIPEWGRFLHEIDSELLSKFNPLITHDGLGIVLCNCLSI